MAASLGNPGAHHPEYLVVDIVEEIPGNVTPSVDAPGAGGMLMNKAEEGVPDNVTGTVDAPGMLAQTGAGAGAGICTTGSDAPAEGSQHDWKMALPCAIVNIMAGGAAAKYNHPNRDEPAYFLAVGSVLSGGVVEMLAALWVSRDADKRGATGKKVLYASLVTLLLSFLLDGFAYKLKK